MKLGGPRLRNAVQPPRSTETSRLYNWQNSNKMEETIPTFQTPCKCSAPTFD